MHELLAGSIGVIEEFFGAELVPNSTHRARRATVITPTQIVGVSPERREALYDALGTRAERPVEDYQRALQSEPDASRATMLLDYPTVGGYRTLEQGLRVVAYFGRVLVDDPLDRSNLLGGYGGAAFPSGFSGESLLSVLAWLAEVRPLVAGGHITFFPPELVERLRNADPAVAWESARRVQGKRSELEEIIGEEVGGEVAWRDPPGTDPLLDRLAASIGLPVDVMDASGDTYVLRYLGEALTTYPTGLAGVQLPDLDKLPPRELAALLSSDEALAAVRSALDDTLRHLPEGLAHDPERAAKWINERFAGELAGAVRRLRLSIRRLPDAAKIGSTAGAVGATVLAGALTATPSIGVALGAAGAAADLTATWLYQWQRHRKQQPALRVLAHLAPRQ